MSLLIALALTKVGLTAPVQHSFSVAGDHFELDGKPFVIRSGEMHYPRVPRAYWADRFAKAKAMGLNTICTYVFWNLHEPKPGHYDFSGNLDLAAYLKAAKAAGIYIIIRPGPYICTELDFGGLPAWLQKDPEMHVRSRDPKFLAATQRYFERVGKVVKPYLIQNGGPVIMTQVENEYGSYGNDHVYMGAIRDGLIKAGFTGQLCTSDGPGQDMLSGGTLPGIPAAVNFGGGGPSAIAELQKFRPGSPKMVGEYWCGWFDHWGERHHTTGVAGHNRDLEWFLKNGVSFNLYMFHGGTSFAFMPGANGDKNTYQPDITSYDYDSPLDESGRVTPKYLAFRDTIARVTGENLPPIPSSPTPIAIGTHGLDKFESLRAINEVPGATALAKTVVSDSPQSFESLGQSYGVVSYRTQTKLSGEQNLKFTRLNDYAMVFVNNQYVGTLDRRFNQKSIKLTLPDRGAEIEVVVEAHARINFGHALPDEREGIVGPVTLGDQELKGWKQLCFPLDKAPLTRSFIVSKMMHSAQRMEQGAAGYQLYASMINLSTVGDTFLDMSNWTKGYVWVNGHNLGRYWNSGPQRSLYLPGCWLEKGFNTVIVLDEGPLKKNPEIIGVDHLLLDARPTGGLKALRKPGETAGLDAAFITQGTFTRDPKWQEVDLKGSQGRYVALEALDEYGEGPYASAAEIEIIGEDGKAIRDLKVVYADSEELENENGSALNLIDHQPDTFWHTQWGAAQPKPPHLVVFDLGTSRRVSRLRYLPRQDAVNGRIRNYKAYVARNLFMMVG